MSYIFTKTTKTMKRAIFATLVICLGCFSGCGKKIVDYRALATFEFKNESTHTIAVNGGADERFKFTLDKGAAHSYEMEFGTGETVTKESFISPYSNATTVKIDGGREMKVQGITDLKNYSTQQIGDRHFKFTYTFTDADFPDE